MKPIIGASIVIAAAIGAGAGYFFGYDHGWERAAASLAGAAETPAPGVRQTEFQAMPAAPALTEAEYAARLPADVYAESLSRVPIVDRAALEPERQIDFDEHISPETTSLAGIYGPGGLRLHGSPEDRIGEELGGRLRELIRLIVSREMDQAFEWTVHEPVALREGLEPAIIDVIRYGRPLDGVPEREAAMIQLGREYFHTHKVAPETYARVLAAIGRRNLVDMCVLMGDYVETAVLLTVNDVHLWHDRPSLLPVP